jgi:hypothetical protein
LRFAWSARAWSAVAQQSLATYLEQRIESNAAHGRAAALLELLSSRDADVRSAAADALVAEGFAAARWLADLGLWQYIELFRRLELTPDNMFLHLRKPDDLKAIGIATQHRSIILDRVRADFQQVMTMCA